PPQSRVQAQSLVWGSHTHEDGAQPALVSQTALRPQPVFMQPSGFLVMQLPRFTGTQTPPPQSSVHVQIPVVASQTHDDGAQPAFGSQMLSGGQALLRQ